MSSTKATLLRGAQVLAESTAWEPERRDILIDSGRIVECDVHDSDQVRSVDVDGLFFMPGLIDLHCHLTFRRTVGPVWSLMSEGSIPNTLRAVRNALTVLRQGVTTIRDPGAINEVNTIMSHAIGNGKLPGPRVVSAGAPLGTTGGHAKSVQPLDGPLEFRRATRGMIGRGATWIKVIGSNDPTHEPMENGEWSHGEVDADELKATVHTAHKWGAGVAVHTMGSRQLIMVADCGVDTIEHGIYLTEEGAQKMIDNGVALVPTLSGYLETTWPRWERGADWIRRHEMLVGPHESSFKIAQDAGVQIAVGTDSVGEIVHELQLMERYGSTRAQALEAATSINASVLGLSREIGDIAPGMAADLVGLRANPLEDLNNLREVEYVVQRGALMQPSEIRLPSGDECGESEPSLSPETMTKH